MSMMKRTDFAFWVCIIIAGISITSALMLQSNEHLEPCPLCIIQRVIMIAALLVGFFAIIHNPRRFGHLAYHFLLSLIALAGMGIAGRHVWLQHLPKDQIPECGPTLEYMLDVMPFREVFTTVLNGSGECAEVVWQFLGLSIPEWALVCFSIMFIVSSIGLFKKH